MKITVLTENTSKCGLPMEHGLSLYVETGSHVFLFDTGQTALFSENAKKLGVDLEKVEFVVLSHGHYDHGGGLRRFFEINDHAPVYMSRYAFEPHYHGPEKYIGLDPELQKEERIIYTGEEYEICPGFQLRTCNLEKKVIDMGSAGLEMLKGSELVPEDFRHEQYLLVEENGRTVLFSGCSHKGILNIMHWFKPAVLIGGFHFSKMAADAKLASYARQLNEYQTEYYTCHCTGTEQYEYMRQYMKNLHYISTGDQFEI